MIYDYEELKLTYALQPEKYEAYTQTFLNLPNPVELICFMCSATFTRERFRVINRLRDGVEHAFCQKGCASKWVRQQEFEGKFDKIIDCTYQDFLDQKLPRLDTVAYMKRPLYRLRCCNPSCYQFITHPWEIWNSAVRRHKKAIYCSSACSPDLKLLAPKTISVSQQTLLNRTYRSYQGGASRRSYKWDLPKDVFSNLIFSNCSYCNVSPTPRNGVDRRDNKLDYTVDNAISCCTPCNERKSKSTTDEFLSHSVAIAYYQLQLRLQGQSPIVDDQILSDFIQLFTDAGLVVKS
jgi:hypothetical protein